MRWKIHFRNYIRKGNCVQKKLEKMKYKTHEREVIKRDKLHVLKKGFWQILYFY